MFRKVKIKSIEPVGERDCYDVTFPTVDTFIARSGVKDGFVVHNSKGMAAMCRGVGITNFDDIININGMYRPGPLRAGFASKYSDRKKDPDSIKYSHPVIEEVTRDTLGLILYQEQVMRIFANLAGFLMKDTEKIRKMIAKSQGKQVLEVHRKQFVDGAVRNGMKKKTANRLFSELYQFGAFSFNKSHCVAYSMLAFKTGWLRVYYPHEFYTAMLKRVGDEKKLTRIFTDIRKHRIGILPPDINKSGADFVLEERYPKAHGRSRIPSITGEAKEGNGAAQVVRVPVENEGDYVRGSENYAGIRCGMIKVKHVGVNICNAIIENAPYGSFEDFLLRVPRVDKRMVENVITCGFFDSLHPNRRALYENYLRLREVKHWKAMMEKGVRFFTNTRGMRKKAKAALARRRDPGELMRVVKSTMQEIENGWGIDDWDEDEKEQRVADIYPVLMSKHPIEYYEEELKRLKFSNYCLLDKAKDIKAEVGVSRVGGDGNGGFDFRQRYMCSIATVDTLHYGHWGDWLATKPSEKDLKDAENKKNSQLAGVAKYKWWATWLKISALDINGVSAYCAAKPDIYEANAESLEGLTVGDPFIMFYRIMNVSERLDMKEILPLKVLREMLAGKIEKSAFCKKLISGKLRVDVDSEGKVLRRRENERRRGRYG